MSGDPYFGNVSLLLHMDGSNGGTTFTDVIGNTVTPSGNAQISTTQSKFGGASGFFDGNGDFLTINNTSGLDLGTGDFTVEFWLYKASLATTTSVILAFSTASWNMTLYWRFNQKFAVFHSLVLTGPFIESSLTPALNTWYHYACVRNNGTFTLYIDGNSVGSYKPSAQNITGANVFVGQNGAGAQYWPGYIDDVRITKGVARYTGNFTPPIEAFPDVPALFERLTPKPTSINASINSINRIRYQGL